MKVTIDNLGVVRHIEFDTQKPLSLFCGPNGTGKTYVSYVLYAIYSFDEDTIRLNKLRLLVDLIIKQKTDIVSLPSLDASQVKRMIEMMSSNNLGSIFGISDELVKARFDNQSINVSFSDSEFDLFKSILDSNPGIDISVTFSEFLPRAIMLTVERNSIYTFKTELSLSRNDLVDRLMALKDKSNENLSNILSASSRRYPMAIRDGLKIANDLENIKKVKGEFFDFATNLEQSLLHGRVDVSKNGDVEFVVGDNVNLPIQLSSSIVKTLSSLILYLKYTAKKGDILIIDEPEMNLHPDNQILLARVFAQMANMGIKLVISTHSDYIIREFNNLIMLSGVSGDEMQTFSKMGYDNTMTLKKDDVAAYMFNFDKDNLVTVNNLEVTETGFEVSTIDAAINSINEASEELYYSLKSRQNEKEH